MTNTNIVSLDLSFNVIRADGAEFIAEVINTCKHVMRTLNCTIYRL